MNNERHRYVFLNAIKPMKFRFKKALPTRASLYFRQNSTSPRHGILSRRPLLPQDIL